MSEPIAYRRAQQSELDDLLALYRYLLADDLPAPAHDVLTQRWTELLSDPRMHPLVAAAEGQLVASCTLAIIPNLTRSARPYGLIENVVTHPDYRRRGIGTALLRTAQGIAWAADCYKVMLLTGSRREAVLEFYAQAGFQSGVKTGFIAYAPDFMH